MLVSRVRVLDSGATLLDREAVKSVSAEARGDAALTRATRTPRGSLREAVHLLAQAVGILWLNDRGKREPPEVLPFPNPARCERRSHCRGSIGVFRGGCS